MVNQQKGVQQETAYSAVVVNDHIMYPRPCLYHFFMFLPVSGMQLKTRA